MIKENIWKCFWTQPKQFYRYLDLIDHYLDLAARTPIFDVAFKPGFENLPAVLNAIEQVLQENGQAPSTSANRH